MTFTVCRRKSELASEFHHPFPLAPHTREPEHEQLGEEVADPPGDFVHVVVEVGLGPEDRAALRPPRHPGTRLPHAAHQDLARRGCQPVQSAEHGGGVPGDKRVRRVFLRFAQPVDQSVPVSTTPEYAPPLLE